MRGEGGKGRGGQEGMETGEEGQEASFGGDVKLSTVRAWQDRHREEEAGRNCLLNESLPLLVHYSPSRPSGKVASDG